MRNFYSQDGEAEILVPAMDEAVQSVFQAISTDFVKGPPSATQIHQSWDRNTSFRDVKKGMETITKNGINTSNGTLARHVREAIGEMKSKHPTVILSSVNESKIAKAIETLTYVQRNAYVTSQKHVMRYQVSLPICFTHYLHL